MEEEARQAARRQKERLEQWQKRRAAQERRLRLAEKDAAKAVKAAEAALAKLQGGTAGKATAAMAAANAGMEDSSSGSEDEDEPLAARAAAGSGGKRKAAVLSDSDDDGEASHGSGSKENAGQRGSRRRVRALPACCVCACCQSLFASQPAPQQCKRPCQLAAHSPAAAAAANRSAALRWSTWIQTTAAVRMRTRQCRCRPAPRWAPG